jgi:hypothetical protein
VRGRSAGNGLRSVGKTARECLAPARLRCPLCDTFRICTISQGAAIPCWQSAAGARPVGICPGRRPDPGAGPKTGAQTSGIIDRPGSYPSAAPPHPVDQHVRIRASGCWPVRRRADRPAARAAPAAPRAPGSPAGRAGGVPGTADSDACATPVKGIDRGSCRWITREATKQAAAYWRIHNTLTAYAADPFLLHCAHLAAARSVPRGTRLLPGALQHAPVDLLTAAPPARPIPILPSFVMMSVLGWASGRMVG